MPYSNTTTIMYYYATITTRPLLYRILLLLLHTTILYTTIISISLLLDFFFDKLIESAYSVVTALQSYYKNLSKQVQNSNVDNNHKRLIIVMNWSSPFNSTGHQLSDGIDPVGLILIDVCIAALWQIGSMHDRTVSFRPPFFNHHF